MATRYIALLLCVLMSVSLCACGKSEASSTPLADKLEEHAKEYDSYADALLMYNWLTSNIESFKDPSSVQLTGNAFYCKDESTSEIKFFLVECRADNSFGGKSVGYVKVEPNKITELDWEPAQISPDFENEKVWKCGTAEMEDAFREYITNHYS